MGEGKQYSIGDVSHICSISKKALRYYDELGLITSYRNEHNNYRYYTEESVLTVPIIKYYKQMGFTLEEMQACIEGRSSNIYRDILRSFDDKILKLQNKQEEIHQQHISVANWADLIREADKVIENNIHEVSVKYMESENMIFQDQMYNLNNKSAVINIEWTTFLERNQNGSFGPVILNFQSVKDRMAEQKQQIRIMQRALKEYDHRHNYVFGGCMMAACYHIGPHETIQKTYSTIVKWAEDHGYELAEESFERYLTDYWTTKNSEHFVTEVMIEVNRPASSKCQPHSSE